MARMDDRTRWFRDRNLGNHPQIVSDCPPVDPGFHSLRAMLPATIHPMAPCESADPALDARAPVVATSDPAWLRMGYPRGRCCPGVAKGLSPETPTRAYRSFRSLPRSLRGVPDMGHGLLPRQQHADQSAKG